MKTGISALKKSMQNGRMEKPESGIRNPESGIRNPESGNGTGTGIGTGT